MPLQLNSRTFIFDFFLVEGGAVGGDGWGGESRVIGRGEVFDQVFLGFATTEIRVGLMVPVLTIV